MQSAIVNNDTETGKEEYAYYAFISYNHEDEKWAKWIQNKLETYKLPSVLQKENRDIPKRINPVFRDKTDITSGPLKQTLSRELVASKYLIVISSPRAALSTYVNYEVDQFLQLGRSDRIIPFIIEGEVNAKDEKRECYVPALRNMEETILGVDLQSYRKRKSFLVIVAKMLDIRLDLLIHRDNQRQKKKKILLATLIVIVLSIGYTAWDYYVPKTNYYSEYVLKWGLPTGIFKLNRNEIKGKNEYYAITKSKADKTIKVKHINSAKVPIDYDILMEDADQPVIAVYEYKITDGKKHVTDAEYRDRYNNILFVLKYSDDSSVVDFTSGDGSNTPVTLSNSLFSDSGMLDVANLESKSAITRHVYEYDNNGFVKSVKFMRDNRSTVPTPDKSGITGYSCETDKYGRITTKQLAYSFDNISGSKVFQKIIYKYMTDSNELLSVTYVDDKGMPLMNNDNYAIKTFLYDSLGNINNINYYNEKNEYCLYSKGYSHVYIVYDKNGFAIEQSFYDENNNPIISDQGYAKAEAKYDERGNTIEQSVYDVNGRPTLATPTDTQKYYAGYFLVRGDYDSNNRIISYSFYDTNNKLVACNLGYAKDVIIYNDNGLVSEVSYYDKFGQPTKCNEGFEKLLKEYNKYGLIIVERYCDADDNLIDTIMGYSCSRFEYDDNRNIKSISYYDKNDSLTMTKDNYAIVEITSNESGLQECYKYLDKSGKLTQTSYGYAESKNEYNKNGEITKISNFDDNEKLIIVDDLGYAVYTKEYDEFGNCTREAYYDQNEKPMMNKAMGYAEYKVRYYASGKKTEEQYCNEKNELVIPEDQDWAAHLITYDEEGKAIDESFYNEFNQLTINSAFGYAKITLEYDEWGNIIEARMLNEKMELFISPQYGYAVYQCVYDNNRLVKNSFYDANMNLVLEPYKGYAEIMQTWDENGNLLESDIFDENGKAMLNLFHYASVKYSYNESGLETESSYYGVDGNPTVSFEYGYSKRVQTYDKKNKLVDTIYYDEKGNKMDQDDILEESFIFIDEVKNQSEAANAGVRINDIVLEYSGWKFFPINTLDKTFATLDDMITKAKDKSKRLVIYRTSDSSIHTYYFKKGLIGTRFMDIGYSFSNKELYEKYVTDMENKYKTNVYTD